MSLADALPATLELVPSHGGVIMRKAASIIALAVVSAAVVKASADDKKTLTVTAATHDSRVNERTSYHTTPGQSTTDCNGTSTDSTIHMDCDTKTTPPTTSSVTTRITEVSEEVRGSDNMIYTIACTDRPNILAAAIVGAAAGGGASGDSTLAGSGKCKPLIDGAHFDAEIKGTTMWVHARKEGRKVIKIKYKILNIRQYIPTQTLPAPAIAPSPSSLPSMPLPDSANQSIPSNTYVGVGGGHWINEVSNNGTIVTLEDGSLWEISAADRIDTALWLPTINITVLENRSPVGDYKYTLINKDDGEKALAKYLGKE